MQDLPEVEVLAVGQGEGLHAEEPIGQPQPDVERPATAPFFVERDAPFSVCNTPAIAGQGLDVLRYDLGGGHRAEGTVRAVRALVQRVSSASVTVDGERVASIGHGLLVLLGVRQGDDDQDAHWIARKLEALRVFEDGDGKMNLSVRDAGGEVLVVSNFTLYGDAVKGNRPSFVHAARPEEAEPLVERVRSLLGAQGGRFGARMAVELVNDGPVTVLVEPRDRSILPHR